MELMEYQQTTSSPQQNWEQTAGEMTWRRILNGFNMVQSLSKEFHLGSWPCTTGSYVSLQISIVPAVRSQFTMAIDFLHTLPFQYTTWTRIILLQDWPVLFASSCPPLLLVLSSTDHGRVFFKDTGLQASSSPVWLNWRDSQSNNN